MAQNRFLVTGGRQKELKLFHGKSYPCKIACIQEIDFDTGRVLRRFEIDSIESDLACEEYGLTFKSASIDGGDIYVSTHSEIFVIDATKFALKKKYTHALLNDVHHVLPEGDKIWIANTGLDAVGILSRNNNKIKIIPVLRAGKMKVDFQVDYRSISTKPHESHPNYIFMINKEPWVTRFKQKDAIRVDGEKRIPIDVGHPHDGFVLEDQVYFTTVNGFIVVANIETHEEVGRYDLNKCYGRERIGWCRGILVEPPYAYVGFSVLRSTKIRENVSWVKNNFSKKLPTRIVKYDLENEKVVAECVFGEDQPEAVFSLLRVP